MSVLESRDYQAARERIKGNPIIAMMAAGVVTVPLAELAHADGTPRSGFMNQANRTFDDAEARNAGNPDYQPYPPGAHRHLGLIAEAVLANRAAIRAAVASAMAAPGTDPESASLSSQRVERSWHWPRGAGASVRGACCVPPNAAGSGTPCAHLRPRFPGGVLHRHS
jgi:hypothetical protein